MSSDPQAAIDPQGVIAELREGNEWHDCHDLPMPQRCLLCRAAALLEQAQREKEVVLAWAMRERDDWAERNADRFWQMNRVVQALNQINPQPPTGDAAP